MDLTTIQQLVGIFGFRITEVTLNPTVLFIVLPGTYWVRRIVARTRFPEWVDIVICWLGPSMIAGIVLWGVNGFATARGLVVATFLYAAMAALAYGLVGKQLMERVWGPISE